MLSIFFFILSVLEQLGGKTLVMSLLAHDDPNVRYEALLAVQKLMVHNWYVSLFFRVGQIPSFAVNPIPGICGIGFVGIVGLPGHVGLSLINY